MPIDLCVKQWDTRGEEGWGGEAFCLQWACGLESIRKPSVGVCNFSLAGAGKVRGCVGAKCSNHIESKWKFRKALLSAPLKPHLYQDIFPRNIGNKMLEDLLSKMHVNIFT